MLFVVKLGGMDTDSLLDAVRGAGMSQRTRRPYLQRVVSKCSWKAAPCASRLCDWIRGMNLERRRYESEVVRAIVDEAQSKPCMCALTINGGGSDVRCALWCNGGWRGRLRGDVPFEFICEIARARALAEAGHVEGSAAAARHVDGDGGGGERGDVMAEGGECGGGGGWWWCWSRESGMADGRIKTEVEWPERAVGCCKRNRFQSLARQGPRLLKSRVQCMHPRVPSYLLHARPVNGDVKCFEKFVFTRQSTKK